MLVSVSGGLPKYNTEACYTFIETKDLSSGSRELLLWAAGWPAERQWWDRKGEELDEGGAGRGRRGRGAGRGGRNAG